MVDADGKVIGEFVDAVDRGVKLDVGHSGTDFRFREARRLFDQGYVPDTISTDLNVFNIGGPVYSLVETMTKILTLGVDLVDVIAMCTSTTASVIGRPDEHGELAVGRIADVSVLARRRTDRGLRRTRDRGCARFVPSGRLRQPGRVAPECPDRRRMVTPR